MKTAKCLARVKELAERLPDRILKRVESYIRQGAVDVDAAEDHYGLPKILLCAALADERAGWLPEKGSRAWEELKNLEHF